MVRGRRDAQGLFQGHSGLYDRRIVAYVISERNDSPLVFMTFDKAVKASPDARPPFRSGRGFLYANRALRQKLEKSGMTQSMSRVARRVDNGPMEGFWGILQRERCYGRRFTAGADPNDQGLYPLLQHAARAARSWRPYADGEARTLSRRIKKTGSLRCQPKRYLQFFIVLLTGRGSHAAYQLGF